MNLKSFSGGLSLASPRLCENGKQTTTYRYGGNYRIRRRRQRGRILIVLVIVQSHKSLDHLFGLMDGGD